MKVGSPSKKLLMNVPEKFQVKVSYFQLKFQVKGFQWKNFQAESSAGFGQGSNASNFKVVGVSTLTYFSKEHVT